MILELLNFFFISTIFLLILYYMGNVVFQLMDFGSLKPFVSLFYKMVLGFLTAITLFSIFKTGFKTSFVLLFLILLYLIIKKRKHFSEIKPLDIFKINEYKEIGILIILLLSLIVFQQIRSGILTSGTLSIQNYDYLYYINLAEFAPAYGLENTTPWYAILPYSKISYIEPYHWGDIWFFAIIIHFVELAPFYSFFFIAMPLITLISGLAIMALVQHFFNGKTILLIISFFMIMYVGTYPMLETPFGTTAFINSKISFFVIIVTISLLLYQMSDFRLSALILASLPLFNPVYAPVIYPAMFVFGIFHFIVKKERQAINFIVIPVVIATMYIFILYFNNYFGVNKGDSFNLSSFSFWAAIKISIYSILLKHPFFNLILYAGIFGIAINWQKVNDTYKSFFLLFVSIYLLAVFLRGVTYFFSESFQFINCVVNPLSLIVFVFCFFLLLEIYKNTGWNSALYTFFCLQVVFGIYFHKDIDHSMCYSYSRSFIDSAKKELKKSNYGLAKSDRNGTPEEMTLNLLSYASFLKFVGKGYWVHGATIPEKYNMFKNSNWNYYNVNSPYARFYNENHTPSKNEADFLQIVNPDFLISNTENIPKSSWKTEIVDPHSHVRLFVK